MHDLLVVGAGIAGLACARRASELGLRPLVLDRARGVGGRCATRRVDGQPVDHGLPFLHGSDPDFLRSLNGVSATAIEGWPERVHGRGTPCHPTTLSPRDRRVAFAEGLSAFPKHLARGLDIRVGARVTSLDLAGTMPALHLEDGERLEARHLVVTLPCEQSAALLQDHGDAEVAAVARLLTMIGTIPCCTVLAGYPLEVNEPRFDLWYPEDSTTIQLLSHDSAKRIAPRFRVLVIQAHARWSREHLDLAPEAWTGALLAETRRLLGDWAGSPAWCQSHLWRHARVEPDGILAAPAAIPLARGARLGVAGEVFHPGGGAQAAYLSGRALAERLAAGGDA